MANVLMLYDPVSNGGTFSGGSWAASLPLNNLKTEQPQKIARSSDAATGSTQFKVDLGRTAPARLFYLGNHNLSSAATVRFRLSPNSDLSAPTIDHTISINDPNITYGSLPWGVFPWDWYESVAQPGGMSALYLHSAIQYGRYIGVDIADTANAAGYVQAGIFMADVPFVPSINVALGAGLALNDPTQVSKAEGGADYSDLKPQFRSVSGSLEFVTQTEAIGQVYRMKRRAGVSGGVLLVMDSDDTDGPLAFGTIYGRFSRVDQPIVYARNTAEYVHSVAFEVEERPAA